MEEEGITPGVVSAVASPAAMTKAARAVVVAAVGICLAPIYPCWAQSGWILVAPPFDESFAKVVKNVFEWSRLPEERRRDFLAGVTLDPEQMERLKGIIEAGVGMTQEQWGRFLTDSFFKSDAPLSQWEQMRAFDIADSCEGFKWKLQQFTEELQDLLARARIRNSRCVPAMAIIDQQQRR